MFSRFRNEAKESWGFLRQWGRREELVEAGEGLSLCLSPVIFFWTWCMAVFTCPAWLINSPLRGMFINCLCWFFYDDAIFSCDHFRSTWNVVICFPFSGIFLFCFFFSTLPPLHFARMRAANSFCGSLRFDWFGRRSWSDREEQGDKSEALLIYYA